MTQSEEVTRVNSLTPGRLGSPEGVFWTSSFYLTNQAQNLTGSNPRAQAYIFGSLANKFTKKMISAHKFIALALIFTLCLNRIFIF